MLPRQALIRRACHLVAAGFALLVITNSFASADARTRPPGANTEAAMRAAVGEARSRLGAARSKTFVSDRYHYSLEVPTGWMVIPASTTLKATSFPDAEESGTDRFLSKTTTDKGVIGIASERLNPSETLETWTSARTAAIASQYGCTAPERHATKVAGIAAVKLVYPECFGFFDDYAVVHNGRGYDVYWLGSRASGGDVTFLHALAGFHFQRRSQR